MHIYFIFKNKFSKNLVRHFLYFFEVYVKFESLND